MNRVRQGAVTGLWIAGFACILALSAWGNGIWWKNHDGVTGTTTDTWDAVQIAITNAQAGTGGQMGWVKICSDITRTNTVQGGQLMVTNGGNVMIGGGWTWNGGAEPTAQSGRSTLNVNTYPSGLNDGQRVMYVNASNVTVDSVILTHGNGSASGGGLRAVTNADFLTLTNVVVQNNRVPAGSQGMGGGVSAVGQSAQYLKGLRITGCVITNNIAVQWGLGGGIYLSYAGQAGYPTIIEFSDVSYNTAGGAYAGSGGGMYLVNVGKTLVANCTVVSNRVQPGSGGSGLYVSTSGSDRPRVTVFGSLVTGNGWDSGSTPVSSVYAYGSTSPDALALVNTTIADNRNVGNIFLHVSKYNGMHVYPLRACNTVVSDIDAYFYLNFQYPASGVWKVAAANATFQHCTMNMSSTGYQALCWASATVTNWATAAAAITNVDLDGNYRFHSLNAANVETHLPEGNKDGDPGFLGTAPYPYRQDPNNTNALARVIDQGLQFVSGGGYIYLDVNTNGVYDALTDIVVDLNGQPNPGSGHFVYLKDLADNPRVKGSAIDRGCYEYLWIAPVCSGTVFRFR